MTSMQKNDIYAEKKRFSRKIVIFNIVFTYIVDLKKDIRNVK